MPTCSSCEQKKAKADFSKDESKKGDDKRCKDCVALTESLFSNALSTRRFDEVSTDAQVERLRSKDANTQADAANKLWALTRRGEEQCDRDIAAAGAIGPLVELLRARGDDRAWTAAMALQALSCRSQVRKAAIAAAGAIPLLGAMLQSGNEDDKEVAALVLLNLSCCQENCEATADIIERQRAIVTCGSVPALVALLSSPEEGAREAAVSTLSCLVSDADDVRSSVVSQTFEHGGVAPLAAMLRGASPDGRIDAARMLKEMAQRDPHPSAAVARELGVPAASERGVVDLIEKLASECMPEMSHDIGMIVEDEDDSLTHSMETLGVAAPMAVSVS